MDGQMAEAFLSHLATYGNLSATTQNQALSATYGVGLAKNHAFVDGQKIAAFLSIGLFLGLNGYKLKATQVDATLTMRSCRWRNRCAEFHRLDSQKMLCKDNLRVPVPSAG